MDVWPISIIPRIMPGSTRLRVALIVVAAVGAVAAFQWWASPERQIRLSVGEAASAFDHDGPDTSLSAIAAMAALSTHLAPDVSVDVGLSAPPLIGRQEVVAVAARLRASMPMVRVQVFDDEVSLEQASAATVRLTVQVTTRDPKGEELADAHRLIVTLNRAEGRWLLSRVTVVRKADPAP